ncbi:MAG: hypothetical protein ACXWDL_13480 [Nocardioides sp.]
MKIDWVPYSASALVAGSIALALGSLLMPTVGDPSDSLLIVQQRDGRWLAVAALYFGASVALTVGLPVVLTLLGPRGARRALFGTGLLVVGCIGTAGYAVLLVLFRALVLSSAITGDGLDSLTADVGVGGFLGIWIAAFYLGEFFVAWGLLLDGSTPRWVPVMLLLHVASLPLAPLLPERLGAAAVLLATAGLCGIGITASHHVSRPTHLAQRVH